jgi:hypothetical protein
MVGSRIAQHRTSFKARPCALTSRSTRTATGGPSAPPGGRLPWFVRHHIPTATPNSHIPRMSTTALVCTIAPYLRPYLEIHGLAGDTYYFRKESTCLRDSEDKKRFWHPRVKHTMLRGFHGPTEGILYAAFPKSVLLHKLQPEDLLYIGCSSTGGARCWRGRPSPTGRFAEPKS